MKSELRDFLSEYVTLSDSELESIMSKFKSKTVRKSEYLLQLGDICKDLVVVTSGCLRLYYMKDDIEVSVWFAFARNSAIEIYSFISGNPSDYFLQAIEDSQVLY